MGDAHLQYQTQYTLTGKRNMENRKPKSRRVKPNVKKDLDGAYRVNRRLDARQPNIKEVG